MTLCRPCPALEQPGQLGLGRDFLVCRRLRYPPHCPRLPSSLFICIKTNLLQQILRNVGERAHAGDEQQWPCPSLNCLLPRHRHLAGSQLRGALAWVHPRPVHGVLRRTARVDDHRCVRQSEVRYHPRNPTWVGVAWVWGIILFVRLDWIRFTMKPPSSRGFPGPAALQ
ncbi:uncharacterized protein B0H18DRAFT_1040269 [Fomitopsis serialis]|uniref:uncharacterized protein n=1 Tax=Fomitopsis serialis TaxID=139415 RepID=UPI002007D213|nr:uncharacterized protein B0H18DRAFT_1040269 [Neoantrodia serialis]KAH9915746.1 hypothetical protein B0H18DRAFT_1040269 [Neoantrodia serialis]